MPVRSIVDCGECEQDFEERVENSRRLGRSVWVCCGLTTVGDCGELLEIVGNCGRLWETVGD